MLAILHLLIICLMIFKIRKLQIDSMPVVVSIGYFILKCSIGYGTWLIYRDYFRNGDMLGFMNDIEFMFQILINSPLDFIQAVLGVGHVELLNSLEHWNASTYNPYFNDSQTFLIFNLMIRLISFGDVFVQIAWLNFASYIGLICLYKSFNYSQLKNGIETNKLNRIELLKFIPFLLPTVLVFGSAFGKESLLLLALGVFVYSVQLIYNSRSTKSIFYFVLSFILMLLIKPYLLLILLPGVFAIIVFKNMPTWNLKWIFISVYCGGLLELLIIGKYFPQFDLPLYLFGQRLNLLRNAVWSGANTLINPVLFAPNAIDFLKRIPQSILFSFSHPFPWEIKRWWMIPISLDSIILLAMSALLYVKRNTIKLFYSSLSFLFLFAGLVLLMMIGFTIPVLGNLVRFKMPAMLMLALSICSFKRHSFKIKSNQ